MISSYFIILFLYIICFLLSPIFSKLALNYVNQYELFYAIEYLMLIYLIVYFFIRGLIKKPIKVLNLYQKLINKSSNIFNLSGILICIISSQILLMYLLKNIDYSKILPQMQTLNIVVPVILGNFIYGEKVNRMQIQGIIIILIGLFIFNSPYSKGF
jgi:multidrug transporter EmrE-like cation transporter